MELVLDKIYKSYGSKRVLDDLSACFSIGVNAILGPNGSGKSTLINIICGNIKPDSGFVFWNNEDTRNKSCNLVSELGYVPQTLALYPDFNGEEYLSYIATLKNIPVKKRQEYVDRVLDIVDLHNVRLQKIKTFSEGMKRRILIAQSLIGDPKILIMDEPTAGLDPGQRIAFKKMIGSLSGSKTIIIATHIVPDVENIADKIFFLKDGGIMTLSNHFYSDNDGYISPLEREYYNVFGNKE